MYLPKVQNKSDYLLFKKLFFWKSGLLRTIFLKTFETLDARFKDYDNIYENIFILKFYLSYYTEQNFLGKNRKIKQSGLF